MKKHYLLLIPILVLISFVNKVNAIELGLESSVVFEHDVDTKFKNFNCSDGKYFNVSKNANGDYIASWNFAINPPEGGGTDTIKCSYDEKYGESGKGTAEYSISFTSNPGHVSIYQDLVYSDPTFSLSSLIHNYGYTKTINMNYDNSRLRVTCFQNESMCSFEALKFDQDYTVTGTIVADIDGNTVEIDITLRIHSAVAYASPGGYGVCSFDSSWIDVTSEVTGGYDGKLLKNAGAVVTLPNCDVSTTTYPLLKFAGWVKANYLTATGEGESGYELTVGNCSKLSGFIKGGNQTVNVDSNSNYYYACYDYVAGVELVANGGTLEDSSGWTYTNGVYIKAGSATLPNITAKEGYEFLYWVEQGTGKKFNAGETITVNENDSLRAFTAMYEIVGSSGTYSYEVDMVKGKTEELGNLIGDKVAFEGCSSTSTSIVATNYNSGECIVTAVDEGSATIKAEYKSDTYIIGVKVYATQEDYDHAHEIEDEDPAPEDFTPEETPQSILSIGSESVCKTYTVSAEGNSGSIGTIGSYGFTFNYYKAKSNCDDGKVYNAMCLDPGQAGPGESYSGATGSSYTYSRSLDFVNSELDAGLYYLVSQIAGDGFDETKYVAVNLCGRVLQFVHGAQNNNSIVYRSHHEAYETLANRSKNGELGNLDSVSNSAAYNQAKEYYKEAAKAKYTEEDREELEVQVKDREVSGSWSGNTLVIHNTGTIILPKGSTNPKLTANCSMEGYTCTVDKFEKTGDSTGLAYSYDISASIAVTSSTQVPDSDTMDKVSFKLTFDNENSAGNAFIITHRSYANHFQRMIIVNPGQNEYLLYLQWPTDSSLCDITKPPLNPDLCTEEDCSQLNQELFFRLKCCTKIENKTSYAYQYLCNGGDCTYTNLLPVCVYDESEVNSEENDMFQINEAKDSGGNYKYACIVAISKKCTKNNANCSEGTKRAVTDTKKDNAGNKFALDEYQGNKYCRVSCKEDWNLSLSKFGNFTGYNAVNAGSYFQIKNDVFMGGSRTCVTTKIDYESYQVEQENLAKKVVAAWNKYVQYRAEYSTVLDENKTKCVDYQVSYYTEPAIEQNHCYSTDPNTGNCTDSGPLYGTAQCTEHKIDGAQFEHIEYIDPGTRKSPTPKSTSRADKTENANIGSERSPGECKNPGETCEALRQRMLDEIKQDVDSYRGQVEGYLENIKSNALDFAMCQNFEMITTIPSNGGASGFEVFADKSSIELAYGEGVVYTNNNGGNTVSFENVESHAINTVFGPFAKYTYEEDEYMKMIEPDNYMVPYDVANNKAFDPNFKSGDADIYSTKENECAPTVVGKDEQGNDIKVCRHYYTTQGFKSNGDSDTENGIYGNEPTEADNKKTLVEEKDSFGTNVVSLCNTKDGYEYEDGNVDIFGDCHTATFYYYKINYIKQVLTNSSFWKNKKQFYVNMITDEKAFAETIDTLSNNGKDWTLYGGYNVFPISMDRRRNLYQYTYTFYNIGMYSDGKLGRIMGGEVDAYGREVQNGHSGHVLENNAHACFYEVYESICRCCGEKIVATAVMLSGVTTTDYIASNGNFYAESDYNKIPDDSALGLYTSTVGLSNIASSTQRVLGANWQAQAPFYLSGVVYEGENGTDQGAELINQIESVADNIYNKTPDYSFTLNPSSLSEIRSYNKNNSYGMPKKLKNYGTYAYTNDGTGWIVNETQGDYRVRFAHYGSDYLEYLNREGYTTQQYRGKTLLDITGSNSICIVEEGNVGSIYNTDNYKSCRWIDYLTTVTDKDGNTAQVRLAFK